MGDKGSYLFAAFGALRTHEDDARRAVTAALALRGAGGDADRPDAVRMGIAHAQVYVGAYGCAARRTFGIVGREVIVAARLMGKAMVGRRREVALIRDALARPAAAPSVSAVRIVIEANAGMGKSTLLQATREVAEATPSRASTRYGRGGRRHRPSRLRRRRRLTTIEKLKRGNGNTGRTREPVDYGRRS